MQDAVASQQTNVKTIAALLEIWHATLQAFVSVSGCRGWEPTQREMLT